MENMPLLEAFIDETQTMRYKLFTADKDLPTLAVLGTLTSPLTRSENEVASIEPSTKNYGTDELYTFTILNTDVATISGPNGEQGSFSKNGRSQVIKNVRSVNVNYKNLTQSPTTIFTTVVLVAGQTTGANGSVVIQNNSKGQFA